MNDIRNDSFHGDFRVEGHHGVLETTPESSAERFLAHDLLIILAFYLKEAMEMVAAGSNAEVRISTTVEGGPEMRLSVPPDQYEVVHGIMLVDFGSDDTHSFLEYKEAVTLARTLAHIYEGYNTLLVELHMPVKLKPSPWGDHPWVKNFFFQDGVDQELWNQMRWLD